MVNRNQAPKLRFVETRSYAEAHNQIFAMEDVRRSLDFALLQYQSVIAERALNGDVQTSALLMQRLAGAEEFVSVLMNLANVPVPKKADVFGTLTH